MGTCPKCGHYQVIGRFCSKCGEELETKCECGETVSKEDQYCPNCGRKNYDAWEHM